MVKLEPVWDFNQNDSQTDSKTLNNLALKNGYEKDEKMLEQILKNLEFEIYLIVCPGFLNDILFELSFPIQFQLWC